MTAPALRFYQTECLSAVMSDLGAVDSALAVLATGTGKSAVIASLARAIRDARGGRVLAIAQRRELLDQIREAADTFTDLTHALEVADVWTPRGDAMPELVVASVPTLQGSRLAAFPPDTFCAVIVDEAHHSPSKSHRAIFDHFSNAWRAGFTATADRLDGVPLGQVFKRLSYTYDVRQGIRDGFLAPVRQQVVTVAGLDFTAVRKTAGEFNEKDLEEILAQDGALHGMAVPTLELAGDRPGLVFAVTVAHADALAAVMNSKKPGCARVLHGGTKTSERNATLRDFSEGRVQFLCNVALLTEGVNLPRVEVVSMARPTLSRALYTQMVGRGTRLYPGKPFALVIDFAGNAGRHKLVTALDVLGATEDPELRKRAQKLMAADPSLTILDALALAKEQIAAEREAERLRRAEIRRLHEEAVQRAKDEADARVKAAMEKRRAELDAERVRASTGPAPHVSYTVQNVDPFAGVDEFLRVAVVRDVNRSIAHPPSDRQLAVLMSHDYDATGLSKADASKVIDAIFARRSAGLCSLKQARLLSRFGARTDLSRERASKVIDAIASNGWTVPEELAADRSVMASAPLTLMRGGKVA